MTSADLPSIDELPTVLAEISDVQAVRGMHGRDSRKTAAEHYDRRIKELEESADTGYRTVHWAGLESKPTYVSTLDGAPAFQSHDEERMKRFVDTHRGSGTDGE